MKIIFTKRGEGKKPLKKVDEEIWDEERRDLYKPPQHIKIVPTEPSAIAHKPLPLYLHLLIVVLVLAAFLAVLLTYRGIGLTWDEAYYYSPSIKAAEWLGMFVKGEGTGEETISEYWSEIKELPSVVKFANGLSAFSFHKYFGPLRSFRIPAALAYAGTGALIYLIGLIGYNRRIGLIAALMYYLMPRIFGHAHIGASESITTFMVVALVLAFIKGLENWRWSVVTGVVFGLGLATKINCVFLPIMLFLWGHLFYRQKYVNNAFSMLFLGPVIFVAVWPWLWTDTFSKILEYLFFHATHPHLGLFFLGQKYNYNAPLAPWHYTFFMTVVTLPLTFLFLFLLGLGRTFAHVTKDKVGALIILGALFPLLLNSMPFSPKYDGIRLFLPAFPFIALLGGIGAVSIIDSLPRMVIPKIRLPLRDMAAFLIVLVLLGNGVMSISSIHPFHLSYYNRLVGGLPGALDKGLEVTYWGEAVNQETIAYMNKHIPDGAKVKLLALHELVFHLLQDWGILKDTIVFNTDPPYDYHILMVRKGFFSTTERFFFEHLTPEKVFGRSGVPLLCVYNSAQ